MKLNLEVLHLSGTFLLGLGVALGIAGVALLIASGGHIGFNTSTTSQVEYPDGSVGVTKVIACGAMYIGLVQRIAFILPLIAGLLLVYSGYSIRQTIQNLKAEQAAPRNR